MPANAFSMWSVRRAECSKIAKTRPGGCHKARASIPPATSANASFNVLGIHCCASVSHKLHSQFSADNARRPYEGFKGGAAVLWIEEAIDLGAACPHQLGHARLGDALLFHLAGDLPRDHRFDSGGGDLLADAGFTKPALEGRTDMRIFPRHDGTLLKWCSSKPRGHGAARLCPPYRITAAVASSPSNIYRPRARPGGLRGLPRRRGIGRGACRRR